MAITLTLFYGSPNAHNGAAALVEFDCPHKPKIKRDCIKPASRFSDRSPLPHFPGTMRRRSFTMQRRKTSNIFTLRLSMAPGTKSTWRPMC